MKLLGIFNRQTQALLWLVQQQEGTDYSRDSKELSLSDSAGVQIRSIVVASEADLDKLRGLRPARVYFDELAKMDEALMTRAWELLR